MPLMQWVLGALVLVVVGVVLRRLLNLDAEPRSSADALSRIGQLRESVYKPVERELETRSAIVAISLNEAFEERDSGRSDIAWRLVRLSAAEWVRLAEVTTNLLALMAKYMPLAHVAVPVRSLATHRFKSQIMIDQVRMHEVLHQLVFRSKLRYQLQVRILRRSVEGLTEDFLRQCRSAEHEAERTPELWSTLDLQFHDFDLLSKEVLLSLRAFLVCLHDSDLKEFVGELPAVLPRGARSVSEAVPVEQR
jgi:hypothetical protein